MKTAYVFPGQGAQKVGMGRDLAEAFPEAARVFAEADEALGFSLSKIIWDGPEEELRLTYYTQPALLTVSIACLRVFEARLQQELRPLYTAGHSLGEYSALVAAGSLAFADAVRIVHKRGQYMDEAVPAGVGAMSAVLGVDREALASACSEASEPDCRVEIANLNCPGQIVISGHKEAVAKAGEILQERGGRVIPLVVSGPFHSSLMRPATDKLAQTLKEFSVQTAKIPVVANCSAVASTDPGAIRDALVKQVESSVLWEDSVRYMLEQGVERFLEFGSGTVLSGLIKKVNRRIPTAAIGDVDSLKSALEQITG